MQIINDEEKKLKYGDNDCLICGEKGSFLGLLDNNATWYRCKKCGGYIIPHWYMDYLRDKLIIEKKYFDLHKLKSYLFFHNESKNLKMIVPVEGQFKNESLEKITLAKVENWYPKNFKEKVDYVLLKLARLSKYEGDYVDATKFIDVLFFCNNSTNEFDEKNDLNEQIEFLKKYFEKNELINCIGYKIQLLPKAWDRVYYLQNKQIENHNVFVAMKFGEETQELREKIKEGLSEYNIRIMDEIEHNHQIVPEMLYEIQNSRFVVVELSHHNNGAYFESGYALGLGKEVIHICKKSKSKSKLHFDVAQINTIFYNNIDEIPELLKKRIKATIEQNVIKD